MSVGDSLHSKSNLQTITQTITQINDPKLQNSNFMRFMEKISKGEVDFVDNQVIEKTPQQQQADTWAGRCLSYSYLVGWWA
jgi:hypothetical protein